MPPHGHGLRDCEGPWKASHSCFHLGPVRRYVPRTLQPTRKRRQIFVIFDYFILRPSRKVVPLYFVSPYMTQLSLPARKLHRSGTEVLGNAVGMAVGRLLHSWGWRSSSVCVVCEELTFQERQKNEKKEKTWAIADGSSKCGRGCAQCAGGSY